MLDTTTATPLRCAGPEPTPAIRRPDTATAGVIGLGYVGLAQAVALTRAGLNVLGYDIAPTVRAAVRDGASPVDTVDSAQLDAAASRLTVLDGVSGLREASTLIICVPTPLDASGRPDLSLFLGAMRSAASVLRVGHLVCVESTVHPGATRELALPVLQATGLIVGRDFNLAYAPERINPGVAVTGIPRVVGGATPICTRRAAELYGRLSASVHAAPSLEVAEAAKMLENSYRLVNVSLVNEFAAYCSSKGIDAVAAIEAAATKPFGFAAFQPSAGAGGHCIPVDPIYLLDDAERIGADLTTLRAAVRTNQAVPNGLAARCRDIIERDGLDAARARILVLGLAYKPNVSDTRNSPSQPLIRALRLHFADVAVHDPRVTGIDVDGRRYLVVDDLDAAIRDADLVVVAQRHAEYTPALLAAAKRRYACDGITDSAPRPVVTGTRLPWRAARGTYQDTREEVTDMEFFVRESL